jgi:hypothetical protein
VAVAASPGVNGLIHLIGNFASTTLTVGSTTLTNADSSAPFTTWDAFALSVNPVTLTLASVIAGIEAIKEDLTLVGEDIKGNVTARVSFVSGDIKTYIAGEIKEAEGRIIEKIQSASSGGGLGACPKYPPNSAPTLSLSASTTSFTKLGRTPLPIGLQIAASDPACPSSSKFHIRLSVFR